MRHFISMNVTPNSSFKQIEIICIGKLKNTSPFFQGIDDYSRRLSGTLKIIELTGHNQKNELSKIKSKIDKSASLICLDETGKTFPSIEFAHKLEQISINAPKIQFVIGGADGLDDELRQHSKLLLSFGKQTWPHMMVRLMLVEQIYRAQQILANHPYHRE